MTGQQVGYIRVSSAQQNTDRQLADIKLDKTFEDKVSAKDTSRPQLQACLNHLREGDTLHVHSIDRLARNLFDLQQIVTDLAGQGVCIHFHKENMAFSGAANPMQELMLQMLGAFAQFERALIKERQKEGIEQCWSDLGSDDDTDNLHIFGFQWRDTTPDALAFERLMQEAVQVIDGWIAGQF
ncbi:recombinase family protein [Methylovulum psychrotolerans]|uniref:DNA-invertase n=1 Tax=Methylovulum psychrotolerans TaxID=1704499 RepID=A0A2S5CGU2_9GAMM|nr:recombinase family protein [Methylovulum psychrotolerans]POZ50033.1 DNA-invertase [Methylovulum psychrotolerans]